MIRHGWSGRLRASFQLLGQSGGSEEGPQGLLFQSVSPPAGLGRLKKQIFCSIRLKSYCFFNYARLRALPGIARAIRNRRRP